MNKVNKIFLVALRSKHVAVAFLVYLAVAVYLPSLHFPFIWDDIGQIVINVFLRDWLNLKKILLSATFYNGEEITVGAFYRPLVSLANFLNYQMWGLYPYGYRLLQLSIHAINIWLFYTLLRSVLKKGATRNPHRIAFFTTLIYAIHPINIESVIYIGSIGEVLYSFLSLSALLFLIKRATPVSTTALVTYFTLFLLALFAKESAITIIPLSITYLLFFAQLKMREWLKYAAGFSITIAAYLIVRLGIAHVPILLEYSSAISRAPISHQFLTVPYILLSYIQSLMIPLQQLIYQNTVITSATDFRFWGYAVTILFITAGFIFLARHNRNEKLIYFFFLWWAIGLTPVLNIYGIDMTAADRWMYFPGFGFLAAVVLLLEPAYAYVCKYTGKAFPRGLIIVALIYFLGQTIIRTQDWRSDLSLFGNDVHYVTTSHELYYNYGRALVMSGEYSKAVAYLHQSLNLNLDYPYSYVALAIAYEKLGFYAQAIDTLLFALDTCTKPIPEMYENLAVLYANQASFADAHIILDEGIKIYPRNPALRIAQALVLGKSGNTALAREILEPIIGTSVENGDIGDVKMLISRFAN